ncbi:hypothetical protein NJ959_29685, partial [Symplocastrum sp. BBK-W-15]
LIAPYLERRIQEVIPTADIQVIVDWDETVERRERSDRALQLFTSFDPLTRGENSIQIPPFRRPDGKPQLPNGKAVSVAHSGDLTLAVSGAEGCDVEAVESRTPTIWRDLLGVERFALANIISQQISENLDTAATRVWVANECLKKAGAMVNAPLVLVESTADSGVWLKSGESAIGCFVVSVREVEKPLVFGVLVRKMGECNLGQLKSLSY